MKCWLGCDEDAVWLVVTEEVLYPQCIKHMEQSVDMGVPVENIKALSLYVKEDGHEESEGT